jgi:hypothetical protein
MVDFLKTIQDVKRQIRIDPSDLVEECINQPALHQQVGEAVVAAKELVKKAKENLAIKVAEIDTVIRKDSPKTFGLEKFTENAISNILIVNPYIKEAKEQLLNAETLFDSLEVLKETIKDRKSMLRDIVSMELDSYYTDSDISRKRQNIAGDQERIAQLRREKSEQRRTE